MNCNYCGTEIKTTPCLNCFPLHKCKLCGIITTPISIPHKTPEGEFCSNTVRGFGDTRFNEFWLTITEDNYEQEGLRQLVAKLKFWFGMDEPIFDTEKYEVEFDKESLYAYLYKKGLK